MATQTYCKECGREFGPGDSGYLKCEEHEFERFDILACHQNGSALTIARGLSKEAVIGLLSRLAESKPFGVHYLKLRTPVEEAMKLINTKEAEHF